MYQRDAFFDRLYEIAKEDRDVVLVVADMAAPALDKYRRDLPHQFINVGIAEQNAILIVSGLALSGKKVYVYAISPFITLRCLEQIRVSNGINEIPITILGMGTGLGYECDGPTHHLIEDIAIMRAIPNIKVVSLTDSVMAAAFVDITYNRISGTYYLRLEKEDMPSLYDAGFGFSQGMARIVIGSKDMIFATGPMVHVAKDVAEKLGGIGVIDIFEFPVRAQQFIEMAKDAENIITLEEHFLPGGLGSAACEILSDYHLPVRVKRLGLVHRYDYSHKYGGREVMRAHHGIDKASIEREVKTFLRR